MKALTKHPRRLTAIAALAVLLLVFPYTADPFLVVAIGIKTLWLGTVAASLTFLIRYGGMVSLAQTAIYGAAGYVVAALTVQHGVSPLLAVIVALASGAALAAAIGLIATRTTGIYFLMITLACGVFVFYFALQAREITSGFGGITGVSPPTVAGVPLSNPTNFYLLALTVAALSLSAMRLFAKAPLGIALQGTRDCPRRMVAVGFRVSTIRVLAFTFAGMIASTAGVLAVWYNGQISPGSIDVTRTIDVLVVAVLGGITRLEGAWIGALLVTLLANYGSDITARYGTVIGLIFILVVLVSPGGILGISSSLRRLPALLRTRRAA